MVTFNTQSAERSPIQQGGDFYNCSHLSVTGGGFEYYRDRYYIHDTDDGHWQTNKKKTMEIKKTELPPPIIISAFAGHTKQSLVSNLSPTTQAAHYYNSHNQQGIVFTQDGYHNVIFQDLNRAAGQKVESGEHIATVDQSVSRRSMSGFEVHGQGPQAAFGCSLERFAVVKKIPVEVKADIRLQALRKTF